MKNSILKFLKKPNLVFTIIFYICAIVISLLSILFVVSKRANFFIYFVYFLAFVSFSYAVYLAVLYVPTIKKFCRRFKVIRIIMDNYNVRTLIFFIFNTLLNLAYIIYNILLGIYYKEVWFYIFAFYYFALCTIRIIVVSYVRKIDVSNNLIIKAKAYALTGWLLLILEVILIIFFYYINKINYAARYSFYTALVFGIFTFSKMSFSIYNFIKAKKHDDFTSALRNINLVSSLVSLMVLQIVYLNIFGNNNLDILRFNSLTALVVLIIVFIISFIMILSGHKKITKLEKNLQ